MNKLILKEKELKDYSKKITYRIKDFFLSTGAKGAVLGLSGGVDSALVATLAVSAIGTSKLQSLIMPVKGVSHEEDVKHAVAFANYLGIGYRIIELNKTLDTIRDALPDILKASPKSLSHVNLAPRVRMTFSYALSNLDNLIVLGTGNRTELLLGYFTKYGDGGVDFLPIGGLYKTQVRQLASYLGIPQCILDKPPSAGLWKGQTDEDDLGERYETIDKILYYVTDRGLTIKEASEVLELPVSRIMDIIDKMESNRHKRSMPEIVEF